MIAESRLALCEYSGARPTNPPRRPGEQAEESRSKLVVLGPLATTPLPRTPSRLGSPSFEAEGEQEVFVGMKPRGRAIKINAVS